MCVGVCVCEGMTVDRAMIAWIFGLVVGALPVGLVLGAGWWWWARRGRLRARVAAVEASVPVLQAAVERLMRQNRALEMEMRIMRRRGVSGERRWVSTGSL